MLVAIVVFAIVDALLFVGLVAPGVASIAMNFFFGRETEEEDYVYVWDWQYPEDYVALGIFYKN